MSRDTLEVLDGTGHLTLAWNSENADEVAQARTEVARLKAAGYQFFLVGDGPADEVAAGKGKLMVQRIEDPIALPVPVAIRAPEGGQPASEQPTARGRRTVATRQMRGGG